jgi:hypothetical protein
MKNEFNSLLKIIASLAFIYIGGAFESYAVIVLLILIGYLIYELQKKTERNRKRITLLLFSIFFLIASFSIAFSGHGWRNRHDILGTPSITSALFITSKAFIKLFIRFLPPKIHWLILFFLVWMGIGSQLKGSLIPFKNFFLKLALIFLVSNFILLFPSCYLLRETPPFRVWTLNCFLVSVFIALSGLQLGNVLKVHQRKFLIISSTALAILFLLLVKIFFEQKKITALYAAAYDNRMQILIQSKTDSPQKEISLEPLPPSGMLYSAEISTDTNDFHNRHLKNYLQLNITPKKKPSGE